MHACWSQPVIDLVAARRSDGRLRREDLPEVAGEATAFGRAVKTIVSGPELPLPEGHGFRDAGGHRRRHARIARWRAEARTWREAALSVPHPGELPNAPVLTGPEIEFYPPDAPPVLMGHYKMTGAPRIESPWAACLDYPATACAYQWRRETRLDPRHLITMVGATEGVTQGARGALGPG